MNKKESPPNASNGGDVQEAVVSTVASTTAILLPKPTISSPAPPVPKIMSRNFNGTVVMTSSPANEAELQLYRVMQKASLLAYYDTLLEMGGDDVQQLCDAGEEEFLEIMALVGMASKPLHVRRLQKALQEWTANPALFQTPLVPTSSPVIVATVTASKAPLVPSVPQVTTTASRETASSPIQVAPTDLSNRDNHWQSNPSPIRGPSLSPGPSSGLSPGSPMQITPNLVEGQIAKLAEAAEILVKGLPQYEPKPHNTKKKICKELENVMNMPEEDPRRMDEIRKYAAIYGRFDCKRKPEKPLTLHEVSVNEAAAQICRYIPALLTRRDELFPLARQVVRDSGYNYSKTHPGFSVSYKHTSNPRGLEESACKRSKIDAEHYNDGDGDKLKRQERLEQIADELRNLGDKTEELVHAGRDRSTIQKQIEAVQCKQTQLLMEQNDLLKQQLPLRLTRRSSIRSYGDCERLDTDDTDSQFSYSNASSPSQEVGDSRDSLLREGEPTNGGVLSKSPCKVNKQFVEYEGHGSSRLLRDCCPYGQVANEIQVSQYSSLCLLINQYCKIISNHTFLFQTWHKVISSSGGNIIAVTNPALPASLLQDTALSLKKERQSPTLVE